MVEQFRAHAPPVIPIRHARIPPVPADHDIRRRRRPGNPIGRGVGLDAATMRLCIQACEHLIDRHRPRLDPRRHFNDTPRCTVGKQQPRHDRLHPRRPALRRRAHKDVVRTGREALPPSIVEHDLAVLALNRSHYRRTRHTCPSNLHRPHRMPDQERASERRSLTLTAVQHGCASMWTSWHVARSMRFKVLIDRTPRVRIDATAPRPSWPSSTIVSSQYARSTTTGPGSCSSARTAGSTP